MRSICVKVCASLKEQHAGRNLAVKFKAAFNKLVSDSEANDVGLAIALMPKGQIGPTIGVELGDVEYEKVRALAYQLRKPVSVILRGLLYVYHGGLE